MWDVNTSILSTLLQAYASSEQCEMNINQYVTLQTSSPAILLYDLPDRLHAPLGYLPFLPSSQTSHTGCIIRLREKT